MAWGLLLTTVSIGGLLRLALSSEAPEPASLDEVIAAMKRELTSTIIAGQRVTYEITHYSTDRTGAGEITVAFRWPLALRQQSGDVIAWYFRQADVVCSRFGRRFDNSYGSEFPYIEKQTQAYRIDIRYWISRSNRER